MQGHVAQILILQRKDQHPVKEKDPDEVLLHVVSVGCERETADLDDMLQTDTGDDQIDDRQSEFQTLVTDHLLADGRQKQTADLDGKMFIEGLEVPAVTEDDDPVVERNEGSPDRFIEGLTHPAGAEDVDEIQQDHVRKTDGLQKFEFDERDLLDQVDDTHCFSPS